MTQWGVEVVMFRRLNACERLGDAALQGERRERGDEDASHKK